MISVIISSYNRFDDLQNALYSVFNQTYKNIEVIVVDDGSSDSRYKEIKNSKNLRIIHLDDNNSRNKLGFPSCGYVRNFGFKVASGKFVAILDDDDFWLENKLEKQVNILENNSNILCCCTDSYISFNKITKNTDIKKLKIYNKEYYWDVLNKKLNLKDGFPEKINNSLINRHNIIICSSTMFRKEVFSLIGFMPEVANWKGTNGVYQDWNYWKEITKYNDIYYLKEPKMIYYKKK
jgi:glycosyltransferase involved in cell wall biosynthesis